MNRNEFVKIRKKRNLEFVDGSVEQDNFHGVPRADLVRIKKYILFTGSENEFQILYYEFFNQ